jgi:hypothetical protein
MPLDIMLFMDQILRSTFLSTDRIGEFIKSFEKLRNAFNDCVTVQVLDLFCNFGEAVISFVSFRHRMLIPIIGAP